MADREKLIELVGQVQDCGCDVTDVVEMNYVENSVLVDRLISEGVTVRERGRWEDVRGSQSVNRKDVPIVKCSKCEIYFCDLINNHHYMYHFCPNCGADMRGEEDA